VPIRGTGDIEVDGVMEGVGEIVGVMEGVTEFVGVLDGVTGIDVVKPGTDEHTIQTMKVE